MTPARLIVLRPSPGAAATIAAARALPWPGAVCAVPLFAIAPVAWSGSASGHDAMLLTSANAVRHAGPGLAALAHLPVWCVGAATASAARAAGLTVAMVGDGDVAAMLETAPPARLLWLAGTERTDLPTDWQGRVTAVPVYDAVPRPLDRHDVALLTGPGILLVHSARAARRLADVAPARDGLHLIGISASVAAAAGPGWASVHHPDRPRDADMLALAAALCQKGAMSNAHDRNGA